MSKIILTDEGATPATPAPTTTVIYTQGGVLYTLTSSGPPAAPIFATIFDAAGDMIYASAADTPVRLAIGAAGQFLRVSGNLPVWSTASAADVGAIPTSALTAFNPASLAAAAAPGVSTDVARLDHVHPFPSAADVGAVALSTVTTAGDLIYATSAGVVGRQGIGTVGQVLTVNTGATAPVWQNPPTFVAGSATSTAQYKGTGTDITGIAAAIAAASAAGGGVVVILPGSYSGGGTTLTLPANVSLAAAGGFGSVAIQADFTCTAPTGSGLMSVSGLYIDGSFTFDTAGVVDGTQFFFNDCQIETASASAITIVDNGWDLSLTNCTVKVTGAAFNVVTGPADPAVADLTADNCQFVSTAGAVGVRTFNGSFNSVNLTGCYLSHPVNTTTAAGSNVSVRDCTLNFAPNTPATAFSFAGGASFLNIFGSFSLTSLDAAGTLYTGGPVTALAFPGTFLGTYQFAFLPVLSGNDGVLAYTSDFNALYVRRSGAWEKVASESNATTWTATQTFNETVFNRAASPASANDVAGTYTFADNTAPPLIRMTTSGGVQTVNLFAPAGGDVGKQWVIFDAGRNSAANNITINPNGTDTINGVNVAVTISTNGGALVFRVTGANSWETIGY